VSITNAFHWLMYLMVLIAISRDSMVHGWLRGVMVSDVVLVNEVNQHRAWLVLLIDYHLPMGKPSRYVIS